MAISLLQSAFCSSLARDAMYSSTLELVGLVLLSVMAKCFNGDASVAVSPSRPLNCCAAVRGKATLAKLKIRSEVTRCEHYNVRQCMSNHC